jgi:hypothetical protein
MDEFNGKIACKQESQTEELEYQTTKNLNKVNA